MSNPFYKDYGDFLAERFTGKVQKITINTHGTCPNRDGTLGRGGCIYCNNNSFSPNTGAKERTVAQQIADGKDFFKKKYPEMRYLAYFQSYTNTYGDTDKLTEQYSEALECEDVVGLIIGTRPDCISQQMLTALAKINQNQPVIIEYGAESSHDVTLNAINRCHTWQQTVDAVNRTKDMGLSVGLHFIMGLPGENAQMMLQTVDRASALPIDCVKFHQMQVIKGTVLAVQYINGTSGLEPFTLDNYLDLCTEIIKRIRKDIAIERFVSQAPAGLLLAPCWKLKNYQFTNLLHQRLHLAL